jgi:hypothetical protein
MLPTATGSTKGHPTEGPARIDHERQRALVLASLLIHPGTPGSTHRRWAAGDRTGGRRG